jgi:hypothetical protein
VAAVSSGSSLHLAPIHGSHSLRCHAVVLQGRIRVLGDGGGEAELSRTSVEIAGRNSEGDAAQGCLPDNRAARQKSA